MAARSFNVEIWLASLSLRLNKIFYFFLFLPTQISSHKIEIMCVMKFYFYFYFDRPTHFFKNQIRKPCY